MPCHARQTSDVDILVSELAFCVIKLQQSIRSLFARAHLIAEDYKGCA